MSDLSPLIPWFQEILTARGAAKHGQTSRPLSDLGLVIARASRSGTVIDGTSVCVRTAFGTV
jgi:hypothetical protein